ncbi:MAG: carbohydrate kinase family protein [Bacillota bacterium]|nr:carbohydrate kinase family protein [Bacillota bacterium]
MKKGIAVAGNMLVDTIYQIDNYPQMGELATIYNGITKATGGAVCNVAVDLAKLDAELPLTTLGVIGNDLNGKFIEQSLSEYKNIDLTQIAHEGTTSFTEVMCENVSKQRTFFHFRGANTSFSEKHIDLNKLNVDIFHIGYILLLDELDKYDNEYGTKMARLLASLQSRGIKTSADVVSDSFDRFKAIVPNSLKHLDYFIINETEAERTTGITLRNGNGIINENLNSALLAINDMGVSEWIVIHAPELGCGMDCTTGEIIKIDSLKLPADYIKGTNGAGDAFCSGILYGAYKGMKLREAIELGIGCAACSLAEPGATEGMKPYEEVIRMYQNMR